MNKEVKFKKYNMKKIIITVTIILLIAISLFWILLPENTVARKLGGTLEIKVEPGQKVMMATFKESDLFYMTEPMDSGYIPVTKTLHEKSKYGIIETKVKFIETK